MHTVIPSGVYDYLENQSTRHHVQAGLQLAPGVMQALLLNYSSLGSEAASLQSHVADAAAAFLKLAKVALLSKE